MYEGLTIILILFGIGIIIFSFFIDKIGQDKNRFEVNDEHYEEYGARIEELNQKILDINEYTEFMKRELDSKHRELLFLYQLIREKNKEMESYIHLHGSKELEDELSMEEELKIEQELKVSNNNEMILQLSKKGYSIQEIAQILDIGKGEVKLVIELYK